MIEYCAIHGEVNPIEDEGIERCPSCETATSTTLAEARRFAVQDSEANGPQAVLNTIERVEWQPMQARADINQPCGIFFSRPEWYMVGYMALIDAVTLHDPFQMYATAYAGQLIHGERMMFEVCTCGHSKGNHVACKSTCNHASCDCQRYV